MQTADDRTRLAATRKRATNVDLAVACIASIIAIVLTVIDAPPVVRIPVAIPFVLFWPGYCLVSLLFPGDQGIDALERIALSFGLSMALVAPIALGIDLLPWGLTEATILFGLGVVILTLAYFAAVRRRAVPPEHRVNLRPDSLSVPAIGALSKRTSAAVILGGLVLAGVGAWKAIEFQMTPDPYTEFALLSADGTPLHLPRDLRVGDVASVTLTITNHERSDRSYEVVVNGAGQAIREPIVVELASGEAWSGQLNFAVSSATTSAPVRFELRRSGIDPVTGGPYRALELWITVRDATPVAIQFRYAHR